MKYRTTGVKMGHKLFKRERATQFDTKRHIPTDRETKWDDHKKMDLLTHAAFQKEVFKRRKKERKRYRISLAIAILLTLITMSLFVIL